MKHVNTQLDEDFVMIEKYNLTPNELFFLRILFLSREEDQQDEIYRYFRIDEKYRGSVVEMLTSLQNKGIILQSYKIPRKGEKFNPLDVEISKNFENHFMKASFDMGKELYEHYPTSTVVNGIEYKLRRVSKKFDSLEDAFRAYGKYIRWNRVTHERVLQLVDSAKETGYQFTTLDDFIVDNDWNNIQLLEEDGKLNTSTMALL